MTLSAPHQTPRLISLFTGIGGIDLGFERAGMQTVAQVEKDPWCTRVLEKHWPDVPRWTDIRDLNPFDLPECDVIAGGFPCQPVSLAGARKAQDDDRWLWPEFFRVVRMVRPRFVVVENVPGLASAGMGDVLGDLASIGYDSEWQSVPAAFVGAPHLRWRIFIVAYPCGIEHEGYSLTQRRASSAKLSSAYTDGKGESGGSVDAVEGPRVMVPDPGGVRGRRVFGMAPDAGNEGRGTGGTGEPMVRPGDGEARANGVEASGPDVSDADSVGCEGRSGMVGPAGWRQPENGDQWAVEPDVGRVAHGVPRRVDRLRGLGNAVVPQVAEWVGRRIMASIHATNP